MAEWSKWLQETPGKEDQPLYELLYRSIEADIQSGRLSEGDKLPSKRMLTESLGISHSTIETAYGLLLAEGYIRSIPRVGYVVERYIPLESKGKSARDIQQREETVKELEPVKTPNGTSLFSFSTNAVDTGLFPYASWAKIYREVIYQERDLLEMGEPQGDAHFRTSLCRMLREQRGVEAEPEQILVGAGAELLLGQLFDLLGPECPVAMENPGYPAVPRVLENRDRTCTYIPLDLQGLQVQRLVEAKAKAVFVTPSHEFPMGVTMTAGRRSELMQWALEKKGWIIEDDYDSVFRYETRPIRCLQGMLPERVIYIGTFSRSIAPSIRAAYMVLPPELMARYQAQKHPGSQTMSRFEQETLALFLDRGLYERHLRRLSHAYRDRRDALKQKLLTIPGATITGDEAGLHFLLHLPKVDSYQLKSKALSLGLSLTLLEDFLKESEKGSSHPLAESGGATLIIGFAGLTESSMDRGVDLLKTAYGSMFPAAVYS